MLRITLPWPDTSLSPNTRSHWAPKSKAARAAKELAWGMTLNAVATQNALFGAVGAPLPTWPDEVPVALEFTPPNRRRRDMDNLLASMKSALDGIALALGVDDSRFALTLRKQIRPAPDGHGRVVVLIEV